jgi:hypothetical protein
MTGGRGLAAELRDILFGGGEHFIGTDDDPNVMYDGMINAFNKAIDSFQ